MSLLSTASLWSNDDSPSTGPKKRTPALRRRKPTDADFVEIDDKTIITEEVERAYPATSQHSIENTQKAQTDRNERVTQLLNQMTDSNDGNGLADFQPLANPVIQKRVDLNDANLFADTSTAPNLRNQASTPFLPASQDLGNLPQSHPYSNYQHIYTPTTTFPDATSVSGRGTNTNVGVGSLDGKLMEKINYMIHMLEQQHNEKTSNITEEFVLYCFLGVFIIFIVDSFARAGRYIR
jgi:hypothetical protein